MRGLAPVSGSSPRVTRGLAPSHGAVPVLLTPVGATSLPDSVADLLRGAFDPADTWCSSIQSDDSCLDPGFVVTFGGAAVVPDQTVRQAAQAVSGQTYVVFNDQNPAAEPGFWTTLDLRPVYAMGGAAEDVTAGRACVDRGDLRGVRWLATYRDEGGTAFGTSHDLLTGGRYVTDADGVSRTPGTNTPSCVRVADISSGVVAAVGTSVSGNNAPFGVFSVGDEHRLTLSGDIVQDGAQSLEGTDTGVDGDDGTSSRLTFTGAPADDVAITSQNVPAGLTGAGIDLTITRGTDRHRARHLRGHLLAQLQPGQRRRHGRRRGPVRQAAPGSCGAGRRTRAARGTSTAAPGGFTATLEHEPDRLHRRRADLAARRAGQRRP